MNDVKITDTELLATATQMLAERDRQLAEHEAKNIALRSVVKTVVAQLSMAFSQDALPAQKLRSMIADAMRTMGTVDTDNVIAPGAMERLFTSWVGEPKGSLIVDKYNNIISITLGDKEQHEQTLEELDAAAPDYAPHRYEAWYALPGGERKSTPSVH